MMKRFIGLSILHDDLYEIFVVKRQRTHNMCVTFISARFLSSKEYFFLVCGQ